MLKQKTSPVFVFVFILFTAFMIRTAVVKAEPDFKFEKYHDYKATVKVLKDLQSDYSGLSRLHSVGKSYQGKELWVFEISNRKAGDAKGKPAVFVSGGLRGDEIASTEACLYFASYLLENYNQDERVKNLVDSKTFYIWPTINPDACDQTVKNPDKFVELNSRPVDEDRDGKIDEDPAEDLNGDGVITFMRVKDDDGDFKIWEGDPRILIPAEKSDNTEIRYKIYAEGLDNDDDEQFNEDGIGGVDINRNFPAGWKMEHEQSGAGMYPGSEPESEALMHFLIDHPNVAFALIFRSGDGVLYRPFDHLPDKEIPDVDLKIYELIENKYHQATGLSMTHGYPEKPKNKKGNGGASEAKKLRTELEAELPSEMKLADFLKQGDIKELVKTEEAQAYIRQFDISDQTIKKMIKYQQLTSKKGETQGANQRQKKTAAEYGNFLDWAYKDYNAYALSPSIWSLPEKYHAQTDTIKSPEAQEQMGWLNYIESEGQGNGFVNWQKFNHKQLGEIEIGGWCNFYKKNPPVAALDEICQQHASFILDLAELTPALKIREIEINPIQVMRGVSRAKSEVESDGAIKITKSSKRVSDQATIAEIKIEVENSGAIGTRNALAQKTRYSHQPPRSVLAYLESEDDNIEILSMPKVLRLGVIEGTETKDILEKEEDEKDDDLEVNESKKDEEKLPPTIKSGRWLVKIEGSSADLNVKVVSEKGGTLVKKISVNF